MIDPTLDADVIIVGGGPAGSALATLLARDGHDVIVLEQDIHPREHVGEALTPSTNFVLRDLGVLGKVEEAGFAHKSGVGWTAPRSPVWKLIVVRTAEYPLAGAFQKYSYNVERHDFDAILLRHAHEQGAKVLQGVAAREVLFEGGRAVGVRAAVMDGWQRELRAKVVVDASGRRCVLGGQLGTRVKDPDFNQFAIYSWFTGVESPPSLGDFLILHFLGLQRAWAWQIPMRNDVTSVGVVVDKADFDKSGRSHEGFFQRFIDRNRSLAAAMRDVDRIRPWMIQGDYSYSMQTVAGPGWLFVGDALRFVDPIFSSGVDIALYSAVYAHQAITRSWRENDEDTAFAEYARSVTQGVDVWYEMTSLFYDLQMLFTWFIRDPDHKAELIRILQGNPYLPESQATARELVDLMHAAYEQIMADPHNLLRPEGPSARRVPTR